MGLTQSHNGHFDFNDDDIIDIPATVFNDIDSAITCLLYTSDAADES